MNTAKKILTGEHAKRNLIVIALFLTSITFVYYNYFASAKPTTYEYATVKIGEIKKSVEGSGKVVSVSELDIQQLSGGKVTGVYVKPGDFVRQGQIIAQLDNRQAAISLAQAKASYDKVINGSTKEDLDITNQAVINAKQSFEITKQQQETAIANAKRTLLNTSLVAVPVYDSRIQPNSPTISGSYTCTSDVVYNIKYMMSDFVSVNGGNLNGEQIRISNVPQAMGNCGLYISFDLGQNYSNGEWNVTLPNKISTSYSTNLNAYNNALIARDQALLNGQTSITNAELSQNQKVVGARPEDIAAAKASLASANLNYENTIIRAPFDGQIGAVSAIVGQQTSTQAGVATIITKDKIAEIALNEIDIVNVKLGLPVELTFDAIPDEVFVGSVAEINTVGENVTNVVSFLVKISIPNADQRIKSGMSVTANIIVDKKENILTVPSGTIKSEINESKEEKFYVMKKPNSKVYVTVGISNNILTEIIEGVTEGEEIVSKTISGNTTAGTQSTFSLFGGARPGGGTGGNARTQTR